MNKIKVIALFGKSASGKDTIQKWITSHYDVKEIVSCTTRPKRDYEKEGKDYFFLTVEQFTQKVLDGSMLEATEFNNWFYGTPIEGLDAEMLNVGVFNPAGIEALLSDSRIDVMPIYVLASDKVRLLRSLNREEKPDCHEICRRFFTDEKDFASFDFDYMMIQNETGFNEHILDYFISHFDEVINFKDIAIYREQWANMDNDQQTFLK